MSNQERDQEILQRIRNGASIYDVAIDYEVTPQRIGQIVKEQSGTIVVDARGYSLQRGKYTVDDAAIERLFRAGLNARAIAVRLNVSYTTVRRSLRRSNIEAGKEGWDARCPEWVRDVQAALDAGATLAEASRRVGKRYQTVRYHVLTGRLRTEAYHPGPSRSYIDRDRAEQLLQAGYSWSKIAAMMNLPLSTLRTRARIEGWYRPTTRATKRKRIEAAIQENPNMLFTEVARALGVSVAYVRDVASARR